MANDNLSGIITAAALFKEITKQKTKFTYRLLICPETIGALSFKRNRYLKYRWWHGHNLHGWTRKIFHQRFFDQYHWTNIATHLTVDEHTGGEYITYQFVPDGSDERQYSSPGFRISTPSIHKSKYYEFAEYHTSADDLNFTKPEFIEEAISLYYKWFVNIDSYCFPKRTNRFGEDQLGKRDLYPQISGHVNQGAVSSDDANLLAKPEHLVAFNWLMHFADGSKSNFEIAMQSGVRISVLNEAIFLMKQRGLLEE